MPPATSLRDVTWSAGDTAGRAVRTSLFALVSICLGVGAHRLAGGGPAPLPLALPAVAALLGLGWRLSRREVSGARLAGVVVGTQLVLHAAFVLPALLRTGSSTSAMSPAELAAVLLCHHGPHPLTAAQIHDATDGIDLSAYQGAGAAGAGSWWPSALLMLALHLAAAGVLAWWLRRGERRLWELARRAVRWLRAAPLVCSAPATDPTPSIPTWPLVPSRIRFCRRGRAPPAATLLHLLTA